jgi:hypothetical protein
MSITILVGRGFVGQALCVSFLGRGFSRDISHTMSGAFKP